MEAPLKIEQFSNKTIWCLTAKALTESCVEACATQLRARKLPMRKTPVRSYAVDPDQVLINKPLHRVRSMTLHSN